MHQLDPTLSGKIIYKYNIIPMLGSGGSQETITHIKVDPFKDCMHPIVSIIDGGFCVLLQCSPFACIMLL